MTTAESPVIGDGQPPALPPRPSVDGGGNGSNNIAAVVDNHPETGNELHHQSRDFCGKDASRVIRQLNQVFLSSIR